MERLGVIAVVVDDRSVAQDVQKILSEYAHLLVARTGVPDRETGQSVISLIVKGSVEQISALCGKLGRLKSVQAKSTLCAAKE
ncbi:MAG: hypothetical protein NC350_05700 [Corallococcus sp.]|nr:hypothetical protein [Corallococcus sp.]